MRKIVYRLLIVEENPHIVSVLGQTLRPDFDITVATTGKEAVRLLIQGVHFDFVITELNLSFFDGLELLKLIRMSKVVGQTPVMVLSEAVDSDTRITCLEAGADSYMTKPFNPLEIKAKLQSVARRTISQTDAYETTVLPVHPSREKPLRSFSAN